MKAEDNAAGPESAESGEAPYAQSVSESSRKEPDALKREGFLGAASGVMEHWVFSHRTRLLFVGIGFAGTIILAVATGILANQYDGGPCGAARKALFLFSCLICIGAIVLWLMRARRFNDVREGSCCIVFDIDASAPGGGSAP